MDQRPAMRMGDRPNERSRRELPGILPGAFRLLWAAGRRELTLALVLEAVSAVLLGVAVLLGRDVLAGILAAERSGGGWSGFVPDLTGLAAVSITLGVTQALVNRQHQLLSELTGRHAQRRILDVACAVELAAFDDPAFHDRVARATVGAFRASSVVHAVMGLLRSAAGVVGSVVALAALEPLLLPLAALALAPAMLLSGKRADAYYRFAFTMTPPDRERHYLATLLTDRDAAKEVRAMDLAGFLRTRHDRLYDERIAQLREVTREQLRWSLIASLTSAVVIGGALALLVALTLGDHLSVAGAAAAGGAIVLLGQRLAYGGYSAEQLLESAMFIEDYLAFVTLAPAGAPVAVVEAPSLSPRPVVAEDVWFAYPGADGPALRGVSLRIEPGEIVALVGANGSGKTTLAKLLAALYVPDAGRVLLGRADTAEADRARLRRDIAVVFQDFLRYNLPARDNIALGRHERYGDEPAIATAARRAGAFEDLTGLPEGLATRLGPTFAGGVDLSLGQWQKLAVARLFFRDAPFVILDEPTAALDARAEHELFARIRELFAERSVLLISHRFSTVRDADRIYVLEDGVVSETGNHDELMALGGTYAELFSLQATAYTL